MITASGAPGSAQNTHEGRVKEQINRLLNHSSLPYDQKREIIDLLEKSPFPKNEKIDILKAYRKTAARGAILNGAFSGMMVFLAGLTVASGGLFFPVLNGVMAAWGVKDMVGSVKNWGYTGEVIQRLECQPSNPPAAQLQPAPGTT